MKKLAGWLFSFLFRAAIVFAAILLILVVTAPLWQIRWVKAPEERVRFEPLAKVVTAEELGPESAFAWLERAVESLDPPIEQRRGGDTQWKKELKRLDREKWSDEQFPKLRESLEKNAAALDFVRKAVSLPDAVVPTETRMISDSTYMSGTIRLSQLLQASASRHASRGEYDAMAGDLETISRLGVLVSTGGVSLNVLVDIAALRLSAESAMSLAQQYPLPDPTTVRLTALFQEMETKLPAYADIIRYDARVILNELDTIFGGGKPYSKRPSVLPSSGILLARLAGSSLETTRQNIKWFFEHLILLAEQGDDGSRTEKAIVGLYEMRRGPHTFVLLRDPAGYIIMSIALPVYPSIIARLAEARCSLRGATLVLAIERYRRETGRLPDNLSELVPKFLPQIPMDPFAPDAALKFVTTPEAPSSYMIYSIGPNQRDERGRLIGARPSKIEGDHVIYPLPEEKKLTWRKAK